MKETPGTDAPELMTEYMGGANNSISNIKDFYIEVMSGLQEELEKVEFVSVHTDGGSSSYCNSFHVVGLNGVTEDFDLKHCNVITTTDYEKKMFGDFNHEEITGCLAHLRLATAK